MSPVGSLTGAYRVPQVVLQSPPDLATLTSAATLVWATTAGLDRKGVPVHFRVQIASDSGFTTIVAEYVSWADASLFDYESSPGVWTALPSSGLPQAELGKNVRLRSNVSTNAGYFWRVRSEQQV